MLGKRIAISCFSAIVSLFQVLQTTHPTCDGRHRSLKHGDTTSHSTDPAPLFRSIPINSDLDFPFSREPAFLLSAEAIRELLIESNMEEIGITVQSQVSLVFFSLNYFNLIECLAISLRELKPLESV